jgi:hypothetical protein
MKATPIPVNLTLPDSPIFRSKGVHVSGIIRCIATEMGILKQEWVEELSLVDVRQIVDPVALLRISIGLAWEEYYIRRILCSEGVTDHPGEVKVDGVYMTADGESLDVIITPEDPQGTSQLVIHEVKATYKSTNTVGELVDEWMWMQQIRAYCKGAGTRFAKMHVLFLCGNYKFPLQPQLKCWLVEFTQEEIDESWELLTSYKDYRLAKESENG